MKIGLLDWGIGGLSVYRQLVKARPGISCLYFSDSGAVPYGKMPKPDLIKQLQLASDFFKSRGISHIVIACNAASTVIEEIQKNNPDLQYYGMLTSGAATITKSRSKKCLVLGGNRTIRSGFFQKYFKNSNIRIQAKSAQPLSAFIEKGDMNSSAFQKSLQRVLSGLKLRPDSILLACTHYPAITRQIQSLRPGCKILDPGLDVVQKLPKGFAKSTTRFYTTGSTKMMKAAAWKAFQVDIPSVKKIKL